ncbi:MAG: type IV secretory system conjugative DNA transfer family protein [Candidatus Paceibacterota bacterium]
MNGNIDFGIEKKFSSPEEELQFLRGEVARREKVLEIAGQNPEREKVIAEKMEEYKKIPHEQVLDKGYGLKDSKKEAMALDLAPEEHDDKIEELIAILNEKGLHNALGIVEKMNDPHIYDDFHRFLIQYVKGGFSKENLSENDPLFRPLHTTLFEVSLPEAVVNEQVKKDLKQFISVMEQFYAGMLSVDNADSKSANYFSLEIAKAHRSDEFVFFAAVPDEKKSLFEKQILSVFHNAKISEAKNDYNIFNEKGVSVGSYAFSERNPIFPIKTYETFDVDPLNVILNSFSKIDSDGEGAAVQFVFRPDKDLYLPKYKFALKEIKNGVPIKRALDIQTSVLGEMGKGLKEIFGSDSSAKKDKDGKPKEPPKIDEVLVENITNKIGSPIILCDIRIIASSTDQRGADEIISDIEAAFNQFENTHGNKIGWKRTRKGDLSALLHKFSLRMFSDATAIPLNIKELTTMMHFPSAPVKSAPELRQSKSGTSPAPTGLPSNGILLGQNKNRGNESNIFMAKEDRLRHFYTIGQTGTGKTTLLKNMIAQDILNGDGVCMIDPHGVDIQDILAIVPKERYEDVIYFDPGFTERPMALNMLEYDQRFPEQKTFVVNEMLSIFDKLFDMKTAGGPMFEQYFRNAVMLTIDNPETGNTLLDVSRVLSNKAFREMKLAGCKNPITVQFWKEVAEKAGGEAALANIVPYITSKFDNFLSNDIMRPIIAQEKSSFNFREVMDNKKILLVNLAKGRLGEINSRLIGLILVGKILMAALSRVDSFGKELPDFYLYIDEFQNVTTDSISSILAEARKYKLSLNVAHQFIAQLDEKIKNSVFGNVGSMAIFRTGAEDAEYLQKQLSPVFTASDIINLDNRNAYLKLLVNGRPVKPFNIETMAPPQGNLEVIEKLKELSYLKFGRPRAEVEAEIMKKYQSIV